jgi:hypothetical protein
MKTYWGVEVQLHAFLTSALDEGEWSVSRPGRFTPRGRAPNTPWIGDCVGPRAVLGTVVKRNIPSPRRESKPRTPIVQPVAQRYTDWAITALIRQSATTKYNDTFILTPLVWVCVCVRACVVTNLTCHINISSLLNLKQIIILLTFVSMTLYFYWAGWCSGKDLYVYT